MSERLENVCDVFVELLSTLDKQMRYKEEKVSAKAIDYIKLSVEFLVNNAYKDNLNNSVRASSLKDETIIRKNNL
jgi:RNA binding exosome subunit